MTGLNLPPIEDLDVEDLLTLPEGYRYELHEGNLVIMTPSTFWHKEVSARLMIMFRAAGLRAFQDPGVLGDRPRDNRLPDVGVVEVALSNLASYSNLPGSAYRLVVEVVSENSLNGEYTDKLSWYAQRGIPEYWIADQTPDRSDDDALVRIHRLVLSEGKRDYVWERSLLLSELEAEFGSAAES
ncbi:Uma2 family endonuclease [Paractinoplanes maris]|uniref:Uma2 family endonuclease n=1 Tax=Paractinoplanes maris TaxID=1734446 RepID=UPI002021904C|nr:Uma2 family endonuclease [Actinoplanes maris]